jgi:hypothetical protein
MIPMSEKPVPTPSSSKPPSRRFTPTSWSHRLVPVILALLVLTLLLSIGIVILSVLGWMPGL